MKKEHWVGYWTIVVKEIKRFLRIWTQTLLPPAITITLYYIIFGSLIGSRIGDMGGFDYMQYIVPGLIMMSVITNAYSNVASSFFSAKFQRSIEELMVSPLPNHMILLGYVTGGVVRGLAVGVIVTMTSLFFTELEIHNLFVVFSVIIITAILFALAGFINAVYARSFDDISIIPTFVLTPLIYLGGVFYSISLIPDVWQTVSYLNPVLYMVNAFRFGILGTTDVPLLAAFSMMLVFCGGFFMYAMSLLNRGVGLRH